ncbi:MAG: D-alanyl-D-alanine carboxypeptidase family protein [Synechococcales bacterium]|nr:D-alanyl-D-alanine carboxypeptidase family protein [Synechococcales bacterium]
MNNSGKPSKLSGSSFDDLPEAVRETKDVKVRSRRRLPLWLWALIGVVIFAIAGWWLAQGRTPVPGTPTADRANPVTATSASPTTEQVLGHYKYAEAPADELEAVSADGGIKLRIAAAQAYRDMTTAAQAENVTLVPLSGFRSIQDQNDVFFSLQRQRNQTVSERADVSAPPGYSEHHTGYAIDIGDGNNPGTNLSVDFESTASFRWLAANASRYSFELSFSKGNSQGVTYEPWHWRFVGDRTSLETFFKARGQQATSSTPSTP